jgi:carbon storage regulator
MLVLSRKVGERIHVGEHVSIMIVRIANGVVRVGIDAPPDMPILREEVKAALEAAGSELRVVEPA